MSNPVLLNNIDHKDLRVITTRSAKYGDDVMVAYSFASEFRNLQAHYPIVFFKSEDGTSFSAGALLGFEEGENLFLKDGGWDAAYIPLASQHRPFLIGKANGEMVMHVDLDHPRVSRTEGEAVFLQFGGSTEYLERMGSTLRAIHEGLQSAGAFTAALTENKLLESFVFDITLGDGSQHRLNGFYTINEERLNTLDGAALEALNKAGYLQAIYMVIASLSNLRALAERKLKAHAARH
ncbi:MAG: SapC family protein [Rhodoferax sp.]|nr:SapC family protein [Rhodoferax sp.]